MKTFLIILVVLFLASIGGLIAYRASKALRRKRK